MLISTKGRYGLRALVYMAKKNEKDKTSIKEISESENISNRYLEQIFSILKQSGLIKSIKGANGGYLFTKNPENIKVSEVLRLLEGSIEAIEIEECAMEEIEYVLKIDVWEKLNKEIENILSGITLKDLADKYAIINQGMFYI